MKTSNERPSERAARAGGAATPRRAGLSDSSSGAGATTIGPVGARSFTARVEGDGAKLGMPVGAGPVGEVGGQGEPGDGRERQSGRLVDVGPRNAQAGAPEAVLPEVHLDPDGWLGGEQRPALDGERHPGESGFRGGAVSTAAPPAPGRRGWTPAFASNGPPYPAGSPRRQPRALLHSPMDLKRTPGCPTRAIDECARSRRAGASAGSRSRPEAGTGRASRPPLRTPCRDGRRSSPPGQLLFDEPEQPAATCLRP